MVLLVLLTDNTFLCKFDQFDSLLASSLERHLVPIGYRSDGIAQIVLLR